jgi:hypothetical protein
MSQQERIAQRLELLKDAGWRAALTIFSGELLHDRGEVWNHIDLDTRSIYIEQLLDNAGVLSGGERRLVDLALSLFNQRQNVNLWWALSGLDEETTALAEDAICNFSGPYSANWKGEYRRAADILKVLEEKPVWLKAKQS